MKTIYVSDLKELEGKHFDSVEELNEAEAKVNQELKEKHEKAALRKLDSMKVEKALNAKLDAEDKAREIIKEATEAYNAKVAEAKKLITDASKEVEEQLKTFLEKHPEGFHTTIKRGDKEISYSYGNRTSLFDVLDNYSNVFSNLLNWL